MSQSAAELLPCQSTVSETQSLKHAESPAPSRTPSAHSEQTLENPARALRTDLADSASSAAQPADHDAPAGTTPCPLSNTHDKHDPAWPLCHNQHLLSFTHTACHARRQRTCNLQAAWMMVNTCAQYLARAGRACHVEAQTRRSHGTSTSQQQKEMTPAESARTCSRLPEQTTQAPCSRR